MFNKYTATATIYPGNKGLYAKKYGCWIFQTELQITATKVATVVYVVMQLYYASTLSFLHNEALTHKYQYLIILIQA